MSKARQRGTAYETSLLPLLRTYYGNDANRRPLAGVKDVGDFYLPGETRFILEAKNHSKLSMPTAINEAKAEANHFDGNTGTAVGIVVHKRHGVTSAHQQWVTMEFGDLLHLVCFLSEPSHRAFS